MNDTLLQLLGHSLHSKKVWGLIPMWQSVFSAVSCSSLKACTVVWSIYHSCLTPGDSPSIPNFGNTWATVSVWLPAKIWVLGSLVLRAWWLLQFDGFSPGTTLRRLPVLLPVYVGYLRHKKECWDKCCISLLKLCKYKKRKKNNFKD